MPCTKIAPVPLQLLQTEVISWKDGCLHEPQVNDSCRLPYCRSSVHFTSDALLSYVEYACTEVHAARYLWWGDRNNCNPAFMEHVLRII